MKILSTIKEIQAVDQISLDYVRYNRHDLLTKNSLRSQFSLISSVTIDSTLKVLTLGSSFKLQNWTENTVQIKVFIRDHYVKMVEIKPSGFGYIPVDLAVG